ncbi:PREDICTED: 39 kDa FK506-binding nuclear protein [Rhagoletis zephyria]|uniref:39 kDa FK506-binding nuclear protein n=1 Tax=Rhagoletis zephyria TaxID=28612 RepID=UPI0008115772|nr:PREDICTED: 39 kDa FK506-binding nuclear protein [Rhagoletis zephyria]
MFWGLNLKPNRKYTQTTSKPFHISLASLDTDSVSDGGANQIYINHDNQKFLICTLRNGSCEQVMLDLNFGEGDEICFQSIGSGNVSLTGYLIDKFNFMDDEDDDESEVEEEEVQDLRQALNKKANAKKAGNAKKQVASNEEEDDDDEDDSDFNGENLAEVEDDDEDEDDDDEDDEEQDDDDEDDEEEEESEDEEVQQPKAKHPKLDKPQKQQNGVAKEGSAEKKSKKDKKANKNEQPQQKQQQKAGGERVITGGVKIEDIRVGNGQEAKSGKRAQVYYEGRLKSNNKVFDSLKTGTGFKFGLGRGEVIKGWDVGVVGMKVGGKRRITCPPHMAYGARGSPPTIPPNSTLVFEVELKGVH